MVPPLYCRCTAERMGEYMDAPPAERLKFMGELWSELGEGGRAAYIARAEAER